MRVLVTSDDVAWCEEALGGVDCAVVVPDAPPWEHLMLLSFCDAVVSNGSWFLADRLRIPETGGPPNFESTFGQVANCLALSRRHLFCEREVAV